MINFFKKISLIIGLVSLISNAVWSQQTVGLFQNDSTAFNGYTLFAPLGYTDTYLIDNCGDIVNTWTSSYRPGNSVYLLPNGNLLRTGKTGGSIFNINGGIIELKDWNDNLIWTGVFANNTYHQHHDIEPLPNGNILLLAWEYHSASDAIVMGRNPNNLGSALWSEQVLEIEPLGNDSFNIVWEWHIKDHLIQEFDSTKLNYGVVEQHPEKIHLNYPFIPPSTPNQEDWLHANSLSYNPILDQIVISSRHFNEFWVIDHSTTTAEAASNSGGNSGKGGDILYRWGNPEAYNKGSVNDKKSYGQHSVYWIPQGLPDAGKMMFFNNGFDGRGYSTVDIIDLPIDAQGNYTLATNGVFQPDSVMWSYQANPTSSFYSNIISSGQRLPNGNTLICDGAAGRVFEIDAQENIVWDYINPVRIIGPVAQGTPISGNNLFRATKYGADYSGLQGVDLTPTVPIELNPSPSTCLIYTSAKTATKALFNIYPNPVVTQLFIENLEGKNGQLIVRNIQGQIIINKKITPSNLTLSTKHWAKGMYIVQCVIDSTLHTFKILKIGD